MNPPGINGDRAPSTLAFLLSQVGIHASKRFAERIAAADLNPPLFRILNLIAAGSAVSLVVSSGPAPVAVPNVVNQTQASATATLTAAGLTVNFTASNKVYDGTTTASIVGCSVSGVVSGDSVSCDSSLSSSMYR